MPRSPEHDWSSRDLETPSTSPHLLGLLRALAGCQGPAVEILQTHETVNQSEMSIDQLEKSTKVIKWPIRNDDWVASDQSEKITEVIKWPIRDEYWEASDQSEASIEKQVTNPRRLLR